MAVLTKKKREILERESKILDLARPMIASGGLASLSMEAIASELKTAKGTIYNHFPNKEEIVLALAIQSVECRLRLFNQAALMRGRPRERIQAIGIACEFFTDRHPELFSIEQIIRHDVVLDKTSTRRQEVLKSCEGRCMHAVAGVIRDGVACGDLVCGESQAIEDIVFGLWSLVYGGLTLEATSPSLRDIGILDARIAIRRNCNAMLDGLNWQPHYDADRYAKWLIKVKKELSSGYTSKTANSPKAKVNGK